MEDDILEAAKALTRRKRCFSFADLRKALNGT